MTSYTVVCDGEPIGRVALPPPDADDCAEAELEPFPAYERVRLTLGQGMVARFELDDIMTQAQRRGDIPTYEPPPAMPGESRLALFDIDPRMLQIVGRERLEAIAAEEALHFGLVDSDGQPVSGVVVSLTLNEWPGYLRGVGPPTVVVLSGSWAIEDDADRPPSRPEA
jgi:hypothetical protein